jgi:RimJ/RimL family protein N-acetyltransferase
VDRRNGRSQRILEQLGFRIAGREQLANGRVIVRYELNAPHIF